jgi:hypothetical protein
VTDAGHPSDSVALSHAAALEASLPSTPALPRDAAMINLARRQAARIDDVEDLIEEAESEESGRAVISLEVVRDRMIGRYLATLDRMGMSPGARPAVRGGEHDGKPDLAAGALRGLQSGAAGSAAAGVDQTAFVDPAVTEADTGD